MATNEVTLPLDKVKKGMLTADYIYAFDEKGINVVLSAPNAVLTDQLIERLKRYKVKDILVSVKEDDDDTLSFVKKAALIQTAGRPPKEETSPPVVTADPVKPIVDDTLRTEALAGIRGLFDAMGSGGNMTTAYQAVKELDNIVDQLVDTISQESNSLIHIADLKSYDEYTYHHSLSVAVLSIAIGQELGLDSTQLKKLGRCAIMHDIGKIGVPTEIINKAGRLTKEEFELVKNHAAYGGWYLRNGNIGDIELWNAVSHHHEKVDGSGYPKGITGRDIPLFSQIISVADVYDAVTSYRSYRDPMSPAEAAELVMSDVGRAFDYKIVVAFIEKLELYPINSIVELSDGRLGIVKDNTNPMRPVLKMVDDNTDLDLLGLDNLSLIIKRVLDPKNQEVVINHS